jgi:hypothetical protein
MRRFGGHLKREEAIRVLAWYWVECYPLLPPSERYFFAAAFLSAQRFFMAATIAALPAALSVPLGFAAALPALRLDSLLRPSKPSTSFVLPPSSCARRD